MRKQKKIQAQAVALRFMMDFVQEDKDARMEILFRLGWADTDKSWEDINDA